MMQRLALLAALLLAPFTAKAGCAVALEIRPNGSIFTHSESSMTPKEAITSSPLPMPPPR